jgi:hypothetical protein
LLEIENKGRANGTTDLPTLQQKRAGIRSRIINGLNQIRAVCGSDAVVGEQVAQTYNSRKIDGLPVATRSQDSETTRQASHIRYPRDA